MSRINTNVSSIIAQRVLASQNGRLNQALNRLSTGLRINSGKDDPAGLIASEKMRAEKAALEAAQRNVGRATNVVSVAEAGLAEVENLLNDLEGLVDQSANESAITEDERRANQLEIDAILESINRIANSTEVQGRKLLNGNLSYTTSNVAVSQIAAIQIHAARVPKDSFNPVTIAITQVASVANLLYTGSTIAGSARTIEVIGNSGREIFTFASGTTTANIVSAVNQATRVTGISASLDVSSDVVFSSTGYGSSQYAKVKLLGGPTFAMSGNKTEDTGSDVRAKINGMTTLGDGLRISLRTGALNADITLTQDMATQTTASAKFQITGGGAKFAITPRVDQGAIATLGIGSLTTTTLGDRNTGLLYTLATGEMNSLNQGNYHAAQSIIRLAADQVAGLRGRLGAFQKDTLDTTLNSLNVQYENVTAAESSIRDADFAMETANMTRGQILVQAATMVLKQSNMAPQNVLSLLQ